jgi:PleD family two-component response regulator
MGARCPPCPESFRAYLPSERSRIAFGRGKMLLRRKTVLVVEDHPRDRAAIRKVLSRMGLEVVETTDRHSAMNQLVFLRPDLICLDLVLPESSGYELCESIRQSSAHCELPLLVLSERASPADRAHAVEVGASAFLSKPFTDAALRMRVLTLLESADRDAAGPMRVSKR